MAGQMISFFREEIEKSRAALNAVLADEHVAHTVERLVKACVAALRRNNKILFAGNGGSAADAQHLAGELVNRLHFDRGGLAAIALTTDTSVLTAIGNDYGYDKVFARQVSAIGREGDVFIGISTSGRSPNILLALQESRWKGLVTASLTGYSGAPLAALCEYCICVPSAETPKIQEVHIVLGHVICGLIEKEMFAR
jgi:D-sedoheptulose 7-phosphate isomerase